MTDINPQPKKAKTSSTAKEAVKAAAEQVTEAAATPARKRTTKSKSAEQVVGSTAVTHEQRMAWIAEAAYYRAEQRGFASGDETSDWLAAEAEVDAMLLSDKPKAD